MRAHGTRAPRVKRATRGPGLVALAGALVYTSARMQSVDTLIVGAGMSGLGCAGFLRGTDYLVLEAELEPGGYCRTVQQDGFTWDYSGHFFHFRHPEIEAHLVRRMPAGLVRTIVKNAKIQYAGRLIDFPFQKNIHQLPQEEMIECLYDLFFKDEGAPQEVGSFYDMLYARFGRGISEKFLVPYNEKLYACDLRTLDVDAMGRFFPYADVRDIVRNFRRPDDASYNATFTYPRGGAVEYVHALLRDVEPARLRLGERLVAVDLRRRIATTTRAEVRYERIVSSIPLPRLLAMSAVPHDAGTFTSNKVLVFNLGFDRKGWDGVHWVYFPERRLSFYRIGFYDNIFGEPRMSLYVEIGLDSAARVDIEAARVRVLDDLRSAGVVTDHALVSWHSVVLDPAYVHMTRASMAEAERTRAVLASQGVHSIGRYGAWTYCAIEDNLVEARALAEQILGRPVSWS